MFCSDELTIFLLPDGCPHPRGPWARIADSARKGRSIRQPWRRCQATSAAPSTALRSTEYAGPSAARRKVPAGTLRRAAEGPAYSVDRKAVEGAAEVAWQRRHGWRIDRPFRALSAIRAQGPRG